MGPLLARVPRTKAQIARILVCLDRSALCEACLPDAVALAKTFGSAITLLHVMQPRNQAPLANDALGWEVSMQEARLYLERLQHEVAQALGRPIDILLEQGQPAERIVAAAHAMSADLTVVANRGERGLAAWNLGSTVQQVLAISRSSVFIAHPSQPRSKDVLLKRILVPLDGSLRSESVLPAAAKIASAHHAELLLVHVVQDPVQTAILHGDPDMALARRLADRLQTAAECYLERLRDQLVHEVSAVRSVVARHANEHQCLVEIAAKESVDLVVVSAHGAACDSTRSFGSVTAYLVSYSSAPLLVLQDVVEHDLPHATDLESRLSPPSTRASRTLENV